MGCNASQASGPMLIRTNGDPRLSETDCSVIEEYYDVIVIGSGYGGSIAACRAARAGKSVCVLERGKEWRPGDFSEELSKLTGETQLKVEGCETAGNPLGLFEFNINEDVTVVKGCGLGGTSLINANVCVGADEQVFEDDAWPQDFQDDMDNFKEDLERARTMLKPAPYDKDTSKENELRKIAKKLTDNSTDIEDMGPLFKAASKKSIDELHYRLPINVTSHSKYAKSNHVGVHQPKCNGCGNCMTGCNTGAKNTVNMNYLPDAKYHGAHMFTRVKVVSVQQLEEGFRWQVNYQRYHDDGGANEIQVVRSNFVILGAGSLGSTEILQRSKEGGLNVSDMVGKGFSGNGDHVGLNWANDEVSNILGIPSDFKKKDYPRPPGPTITSILDMRGLRGEVPYHQQLVVEDCSVARAITPAYKALLYVASPFMGKDFDKTDDWSQFADKLTGDAVEKSQVMLSMSHDHVDGNGEFSSGDIVLDKDGVRIDWKHVGENPNYFNLEKVFKLGAVATGGEFVEYPLWSNIFRPLFKGRSTITVHPLGGCNMGESGKDGVVNHKGQVFAGNTGNVLPGLYVMDGAVLPRSVGINPLLTISGVAERCMRLMANDNKWTINNAFEQNPESINWNSNMRPGVRIEEVLKGEFVTNNNERNKCDSHFTLLSDDLEYFVDKDPNHELLVDGIFVCSSLSKHPITTKGTIQMFTPDAGPHSVVGQYHMHYNLTLTPKDTKMTYLMVGHKIIKKDDHAERLGFEDTTNVTFVIYKGKNKHGDNVIGKGEMTMPVAELVKSVRSIQITNIKGGWSKEHKLKKQFTNFFLGKTFDIYSPFSSSQMISDEYREKRPLNLPDAAQPRVYKILTHDKQVNRLIRYRGGHKGPVLLIHGHGTSSVLFTLDTVAENFVEHLVKKKYDVWLIDWRAAFYKHSASLPYTFDDVAKYDIPSAVDRVLKETNHKDIEVLCHCAGSQVFWMSMLAGYLDGKIRCVASSQVGLITMPSSFNKFKTGLHLSEFAQAIGISALDAYDEDKDWLDKVYENVSKSLADTLLSIENECKNSVCHKLTAAYGLLWEHGQLNNDTHRSLHELFGQGSMKAFVHLSKNFRACKLVGYDDDDLYLPGYSEDKDKRMSSDAYQERMKRCDLPQLLIMSELNNIYQPPETLMTMYDLLTEAHPEHAHLFEYSLLKGYGHLGKDVFPRIVTFLDKYADEDRSLNGKLFERIKQAFLAEKPTAKETCTIIEPDGPVAEKLHHCDFDADVADDDIIKLEKPELLGLLEELEIAAIELDEELPFEDMIVWKKRLHYTSDVSYQKPEPMCQQDEVRFVPVKMSGKKRDIYVISDSHIGSQQSVHRPQVLADLFEKIKAASFEIHSLMLLGDIFELWDDGIHYRKLTSENLLSNLKATPAALQILDAVKDLAENHDVSVYFLPGNHDYKITSEICREVFGEKVHYVRGILVMEIEEEDEIYRCRFEHGHDWDLFNSYALAGEPDGLLPGEECIGHFIGRCQGIGKYKGNLTSVIESVLPSILQSFGFDVFGSLVTKLLSTDTLQRYLTSTLMERALNAEIHPDQKFFVNDKGEFITYADLLKYKYVSRLVKKFGSSRVFDMLKHSLEDVSDFLASCDEDVVVVGHTHNKKCRTMAGRHRDVIYANSGGWTDDVAENSSVKITPPRHDVKNGHGKVELNYIKDRDTFH